MPINERSGARRLLLPAMVFFMTAIPLRAATIEVEQEDEDLSTPTPLSAAAPAPSARPAASPSKAVPAPEENTAVSPAPEAASATRRVRVSDNVGFYYFVKAGYVADPDSVPSIGNVVGSLDYNLSYTTSKHTFLEVDPDKAKVSTGDLLVVYRAEKSLAGPDSEVRGFQVQNLAIVRVLEIQKRYCQVEVVKSFGPFEKGDKVEVYDNEIQRWKRAQAKKNLPAQPVKCLVMGGNTDGEQQTYNQLDFIYLSAGSKKGVVEGQTFRLWKVADTGLMEDPVRTPVGEAQVIFTGPDFSTAQILKNIEPIEKDFEADYQP